MEQQAITLSQLNSQIRETIEARFDEEVWVIAEVSELNVNSKGHCYVDFIERDELTKKIVARQRATIWAFQYRLISGYFETTTGQQLAQGMKVLVKVRVNFHVLYGFSLNVVDIEPAYTLGEQAKHREEIIRRLEDEGVFEMNRGLEIPLVPKKLAIISSDTAAGFGDFVNHLEFNEYGYVFHWELFKASMQGVQTSETVVAALAEVFNREHEFDAILIIRGGGAKSELSAFDDYEIAFMISQSPLPVLTGIGHERDESIADMVAWHAFKTPTAVADFIINRIADFESILDDLAQVVVSRTSHFLDNEKASLNELFLKLQSSSQLLINDAGYQLQRNATRMQQHTSMFVNKKYSHLADLVFFTKQAVSKKFMQDQMRMESNVSKVDYAVRKLFTDKHHQLAIFSEKALQNDPQRLLKSGYGFVTKKGKRIASVKDLQKNDAIKIAFTDGIANATIEEVDEN
jgi:exodeoxyribonuclease VII large subunit